MAMLFSGLFDALLQFQRALDTFALAVGSVPA
jgi:hypothetical protein